MSSVSEDVKCPRCRYDEAILEFSTNSSVRESLFCPKCGYCEEDGKVICPGYGAYAIHYKGPFAGSSGNLTKTPTQKTIKQFKKKFCEPGIDKSKSFMTVWDLKLKKIRVIIGNIKHS